MAKNHEAMQAASQSETWGMEWQNLDVSLEEKELAFATFFCGSVESSHWEAISATLKQLLMLFTWK